MSRPEPSRHRLGRTPWLVLILLLAGLIGALAIQTLFAGARAPYRDFGRPVLGASAPGPLVDVSGSTLRWGRGDPGGVGIALVDVGGADTDAAAAAGELLGQYGIEATWFLSGRTISDRPAVVAEALGRGEVGVTGFSGGDLAALPAWRARAELSATQAALAARAHVTASLLLLPATPRADMLDAAGYRAAEIAARQGYGLVLGVEPEGARGGEVALVRLNDRGVDRLEALLQRLTAEGVRPLQVSQLAQLETETNPTVSTAAQANGWAILGTDLAARLVVSAIQVAFWPVTILLGIRAAVSTIAALVHSRRRPSGRWRGPVTVIVPAYNEAASIRDTVLSLVRSDWPYGVTVVVVDDGSTDGTAAIVRRMRLPNVAVVRQANTGKPGALNAGLAVARSDVVVMLDGDTVFQPDTIGRLVAPFSDPLVGAVSGNAKVRNRTALLGRWQHIEYVMGFNLDRRLLAMCQAILTVPGAVGAFRSVALHQVGGISDDTLAEDTDLTIALARSGWRVIYKDDALAWTEAPFTTGDLWRQRYRWSYGTLQAVWKHRHAVVERRGVGLVGLPYAWIFQVGLPLLAPIADVVAAYTLLTQGLGAVVWTWLAFGFAHLALAVVAFRLDGERLRTLWALPLQQVFYRQLMYLVVIQSVLTALAGTRLRWHKLRRIAAPA